MDMDLFDEILKLNINDIDIDKYNELSKLVKELPEGQFKKLCRHALDEFWC